jgi:hypothetical protein
MVTIEFETLQVVWWYFSVQNNGLAYKDQVHTIQQ